MKHNNDGHTKADRGIPAIHIVSIARRIVLGRCEGLVVQLKDCRGAVLTVCPRGENLLSYRRFQAAVLHVTGRLYRCPEAEAPGAVGRKAWLDVLGGILERTGGAAPSVRDPQP